MRYYVGDILKRIFVACLVALMVAGLALPNVEAYAENSTDTGYLVDKSKSNDAELIEFRKIVQAQIDEIAKKYGAVGLSVAIVQNGMVVDTYSYGWATKNELPMTADSKIRIASISKVVLGMAIAKQQEKGLVNIDASIGDYWGFPIYSRSHPDVPVTMRSIMSHTSTIKMLGDSAGSASSVIPKLKDGSIFTGATPGSMSAWGYNNYAIGILGMTVEKATSKTVDQMLKEDFFIPMNIDAGFGGKYIVDKANIANIYRDGSISRSVNSTLVNAASEVPGTLGTYFAGGLVISAYDMGKLVAMMANDGVYNGTAYLQPATVAMIETFDSTPTPDGFYQALPLRYRENMYGRNHMYYHTGSAYGVYNAMSYDPDLKDGIVVLTSGAAGYKDQYGVYKVCGEISDFLYKFY